MPTEPAILCWTFYNVMESYTGFHLVDLRYVLVCLLSEWCWFDFIDSEDLSFIAW
jgi:hypothetical protein